jgi:signal peptidase I
MKKKIIISAAVFCSLLTVLWIVNLFTGTLQLYKIPTPSSEPNIKQGEKVFVSTLKNPALYKFIVFTSEYEDSINMVSMPDLKAGSRYLHRLCGIPGDIIEMKNGIFYVNNKNFDKTLNLNNQYKISSAESDLIDEDDKAAMEKSGGIYMISKDSALVVFDNVLMKKYEPIIKKTTLYIMPHAEYGAFKWNNKDAYWTPDNFGPLKIPADCYFVLGDNRHNAMDSRYIGFVKKENIKGVVLNK